MFNIIYLWFHVIVRALVHRPFFHLGRRVSIFSLHHFFDNIVTLYHMIMVSSTFLHVTDVSTRFSVSHIVLSVSFEKSIIGFETYWQAQFWPLCFIQGDMAFHTPLFPEFATHMLGASFRLLPPWQRKKPY